MRIYCAACTDFQININHAFKSHKLCCMRLQLPKSNPSQNTFFFIFFHFSIFSIIFIYMYIYNYFFFLANFVVVCLLLLVANVDAH